MLFALNGGVWLHRHRYYDEPMVHLVSSDKDALLALGQVLGMRPAWLQFKPLKHPDSGMRVDAWHWDIWGDKLQLLKPEGPPR